MARKAFATAICLFWALTAPASAQPVDATFNGLIIDLKILSENGQPALDGDPAQLLSAAVANLNRHYQGKVVFRGRNAEVVGGPVAKKYFFVTEVQQQNNLFKDLHSAFGTGDSSQVITIFVVRHSRYFAGVAEAGQRLFPFEQARHLLMKFFSKVMGAAAGDNVTYGRQLVITSTAFRFVDYVLPHEMGHLFNFRHVGIGTSEVAMDRAITNTRTPALLQIRLMIENLLGLKSKSATSSIVRYIPANGSNLNCKGIQYPIFGVYHDDLLKKLQSLSQPAPSREEVEKEYEDHLALFEEISQNPDALESYRENWLQTSGGLLTPHYLEKDWNARTNIMAYTSRLYDDISLFTKGYDGVFSKMISCELTGRLR